MSNATFKILLRKLTPKQIAILPYKSLEFYYVNALLTSMALQNIHSFRIEHDDDIYSFMEQYEEDLDFEGGPVFDITYGLKEIRDFCRARKYAKNNRPVSN